MRQLVVLTLEMRMRRCKEMRMRQIVMLGLEMRNK